MKKIAIVDKYPKGDIYSKYFPFEYELYHLMDTKKDKVLKKDITIEIDKAEYAYIIAIGAEPTKFFDKTTSVTVHQGTIVADNVIPLVDPAILVFKREFKASFDRALQHTIDIIEGKVRKVKPREVVGITNEVEAEEVLNKILNSEKEIVALDTETSALYPRDGYLLGISIADSTDIGYYISSDCITDTCEILLQNIINKKTIVFHNAKFDISFLQYHLGLDFKLNKLNEVSFHDTMLLHYVLDETTGTHGLKDLAIKYTDLGDYDRELDTFKKTYCRQHKVLQRDFTYDLIPFDIMYKYAALDAVATLELFDIFYSKVKDSRIESAYEMLIRGTKFLVHVQENGVPFDYDKLIKAQIQLEADIWNSMETIYSYKEVKEFEEEQSKKFNPNSVAQLIGLLYNKLNLPKVQKRTATGNWSMDAEVLTTLAEFHPIANAILTFKKLNKIKSTYIDKIIVGLDRDGRLRTNFNLTTTTSGRLSSSGKLNMQQLPRDNKIVKKCISAPVGYKIVSQDLATAEMYVAAALSGDTNLQKVFKDKSGADFHSIVAKMVFNPPCSAKEIKKKYPYLRQASKAISFGILYGSGPQKVADTVNLVSETEFTIEDAKEAITKYFNKFPKLKKWLGEQKKYIEAHGYIYSAFNRKRRLPNVASKDNAVKGHEIRSGINFLVQSVASDINLLAGIEAQQYILDNALDAEIFGLVHDSILAIVKDEDVKEYCDMLKVKTQANYGVMIPGCPIGIDVEIGQNYAFVEDED